jgi:membrane-associated protease RseP (regulator of RpoE activity)
MIFPEQDTLNSLVTGIFRVDDVTAGRDGTYIYRYRGLLTAPDSAAAYDQLAEALKPHGLMPLFRKEEDGRHLILLVAAPAPPKASNPMINIVLFVLTVLCVMAAGAQIPANVPVPKDDDFAVILLQFQYMLTGWPFALSLMSILLAHEFGHYFASRYHKLAASLPYFIPMPLPPVGTMGAVIRLKETPKNKRILLDVGIAGPLAGLVVAIPVLLIGLHMSSLEHNLINTSGIEGNSILYLLLKYITFGQMLPAPASYSLPPVLHWLVYFFTGMPAPAGGTDVLLNPVAWAGWVGLLVTSLNLIPAGQLDGGHMMYVLFGGKRLRSFLPYIMGVLAVLGIFSIGWWLWIALLNFFGRMTDDPRDQITELGPARRALAIFGIVVFFLVFMPVPFPAPIYSLFEAFLRH